ncbi:hypothetical protein [Arthrobacter sp. MA-N2]|uniref:hypothetical protein n=1 Tax=Arthrobacter sp. MA-N2 TaxID=1101188 RepID=UPI0004AFF805|nr:hypothetical protein [Arthrobacter sp. MA-N2]
MEFIGVLAFIILIANIAASVSAVVRNGRGHSYQDHSEPWTAPELPSNACWTLRAF